MKINVILYFEQKFICVKISFVCFSIYLLMNKKQIRAMLCGLSEFKRQRE